MPRSPLLDVYYESFPWLPPHLLRWGECFRLRHPLADTAIVFNVLVVGHRLRRVHASHLSCARVHALDGNDRGRGLEGVMLKTWFSSGPASVQTILLAACCRRWARLSFNIIHHHTTNTNIHDSIDVKRLWTFFSFLIKMHFNAVES